MSCGDIVVLQFKGTAEHFVEFYVPVAFDTRIRCSSAEIAVGELLHDVFTEIILEVEHQMLESKPSCHASCVLHIGKGTAGLSLFLSLIDVLIGEKFQSNAHDIKALLSQQHSGNGTVNSSAHTDHDLFHIFAPFKNNRRTMFASDDTF